MADATRDCAICKYNSNKLYLISFFFVLLIIPVNIGKIRVFNEPIIAFSFFASFIFILSKAKITKAQLLVLIISLLFSSLFLIILLFNMPDIFVFKDVVETIKPIIYGVIIVAGCFLSEQYNDSKIVKCILVVAIISVLFSSLVFFKPLFFLVDMYKGRLSSEPLHFFRFSGTMAYPGPFSYWLVLAIQAAFYAYQKKYIKGRSFLPICTILLWGFFMTGSRGGVIVFLLMNLLYVFIYWKKKRTLLSYCIMIFLLGILLLVLRDFIKDSKSIKYIITGINNPLESSFMHRVKELRYVHDAIMSGKIFGSGPNNIFIQNAFIAVETAYFYYGYKYGMIGLMFYGIIIFYAFFCFCRGVMQKKNNFAVVFFMWSLVCLTVGALNESVTEEYKSFYVFFLLYGIFAGVLTKSRAEKRE